MYCFYEINWNRRLTHFWSAGKTIFIVITLNVVNFSTWPIYIRVCPSKKPFFVQFFEVDKQILSKPMKCKNISIYHSKACEKTKIDSQDYKISLIMSKSMESFLWHIWILQWFKILWMNFVLYTWHSKILNFNFTYVMIIRNFEY